MPKYVLRMTRDTSQSVDLIVTAENEELAEQKAYQEARTNWDLPWQDDDFAGKPYCPDYDEIEQYDPALHPVSDGYYELREE